MKLTDIKNSLNESTLRLDEGTRSQVGLIDKSGKIVSAYVHYDGYPSNMKPGIKKHMKNEKDVLKLIKMGGARGIFDDKDIEYYKSQSKPTKGDVKDIKKYLKTSDSRGGAEYVYLYDMRDKKWYMADVRASELKGLYESVNEGKYDIGMARKGNGVTVYNKAEEEKGDYKNVAHIDSKGKIKYYDKKVPSKIKKQIEAEAKKMMEIKIEGTMKLTDLLNEDVYVKNKKTGNTYQVKNANPAKHEPPSKGDIAKAKSDAEDEPNRQSSKEEPKKDEPKNDGPKIELSKDFDEIYSARDLENDVEGLKGKIPDEDYEKIEDARLDFEQLEQMADEAKDVGYEDAEEAEEDGLDWRTQSELDKISDDLKDMIRQANGTPKEEPKKDEPKSEPKRVPLDKNDSYYIKTAVEKKMGPAAFKALSYGDMQKAYNDEMKSRGWEKGNDGEWTKPANESSKRKIKESKGHTMKLKDLLKESFEKGKVYSNPFHTPFVKENDMDRGEESNEMNNEQKSAFLEAVKSYKKFGESIYRKEGLTKVYESIRGLVEIAGKNMVKETEGSFDGITVGRHVKRMNESFKVFEKTLREVGTLQQRLESSYDEIGETLGKYYEINELEEGNEFGANRAKAIANGDSEFSVDGKTYPVKKVDKDDKENAKEFTNESKSMKLTSMLNESFGFGELPSSKLMKMKVSAKEMMDSVKNKKVNESPVSLNKAEMEKLHKDGEIEKDGHEIEFTKEEKMNEGGFSTWEMRFSDMNLGGVKLSKKNVYRVKARNTVEAIKKAAKMAGVGKNWIATETHSLKKLG